MFMLYFAFSYIFTLILGYLETPTREPDSRLESQTSETSVWYSNFAICVMCMQALVSIVLFQNTGLFPIAAVFLAFTLLSHHAVIHRHTDFKNEACACIAFQCKDVSNHETWVVGCVIAAVVSLARL